MLTSESYNETLDEVELQFEFIRYALKAIPKGKKEQFFATKRADRLAKTQQGYELLEKHLPDLRNVLPEFEISEPLKQAHLASTKRKLLKSIGPQNFRFQVEFAEDKLNQSELLLLVAFFEYFMKQVHIGLLSANPKLVFGRKNSGKRVFLRDVFHDGYDRILTSDFFKGLVAQEVRQVDGMGVVGKAKYYKDHFEIVWADKEDMAVLERFMKLRNNISHHIADAKNADAKKTTHVSNADLADAKRVFRSIPSECLRQAAAKYRDYFRYP